MISYGRKFKIAEVEILINYITLIRTLITYCVLGLVRIKVIETQPERLPTAIDPTALHLEVMLDYRLT